MSTWVKAISVAKPTFRTPVVETHRKPWCLHYQKSNNDHLAGFYYVTGKYLMVT